MGCGASSEQIHGSSPAEGQRNRSDDDHTNGNSTTPGGHLGVVKNSSSPNNNNNNNSNNNNGNNNNNNNNNNNAGSPTNGNSNNNNNNNDGGTGKNGRASPESSMRTGAVSVSRISVVSNQQPQVINGFPVYTFIDSSKCTVKSVIQSKTKVESICRYLDSVRRIRDLQGYFRNPEEPIEMEGRTTDSVGAGSQRMASQRFDVSASNYHAGQSNMNLSMQVYNGDSTADLTSPGRVVLEPGSPKLAKVNNNNNNNTSTTGNNNNNNNNNGNNNNNNNNNNNGLAELPEMGKNTTAANASTRDFNGAQATIAAGVAATTVAEAVVATQPRSNNVEDMPGTVTD